MANRKKQIEMIQKRAAEFSSEIETLKGELEESFDNLPENLQYSDRGERMQERIDLLDSWIMAVNEIAEETFE